MPFALAARGCGLLYLAPYRRSFEPVGVGPAPERRSFLDPEILSWKVQPQGSPHRLHQDGHENTHRIMSVFLVK